MKDYILEYCLKEEEAKFNYRILRALLAVLFFPVGIVIFNFEKIEDSSICNCVQALLHISDLQWGVVFVFLVILLIVIVIIGNTNHKKLFGVKMSLREQKLENLKIILKVKFNIDTREKVEELRNLYQEYIDADNKEINKYNAILVAIVSACGTVLKVSFENMDAIDIKFNEWMYFALVLTFIVSFMTGLLYLGLGWNPLKGKYTIMIRYLKDLLLGKTTPLRNLDNFISPSQTYRL